MERFVLPPYNFNFFLAEESGFSLFISSLFGVLIFYRKECVGEIFFGDGSPEAAIPTKFFNRPSKTIYFFESTRIEFRLQNNRVIVGVAALGRPIDITVKLKKGLDRKFDLVGFEYQSDTVYEYFIFKDIKKLVLPLIYSNNIKTISPNWRGLEALNLLLSILVQKPVRKLKKGQVRAVLGWEVYNPTDLQFYVHLQSMAKYLAYFGYNYEVKPIIMNDSLIRSVGVAHLCDPLKFNYNYLISKKIYKFEYRGRLPIRPAYIPEQYQEYFEGFESQVESALSTDCFSLINQIEYKKLEVTKKILNTILESVKTHIKRRTAPEYLAKRLFVLSLFVRTIKEKRGLLRIATLIRNLPEKDGLLSTFLKDENIDILKNRIVFTVEEALECVAIKNRTTKATKTSSRFASSVVK